MPTIKPEIINKFADAQPTIWAEVSKSATEKFGRAIGFTSPLTIGSRPEDAAAEIHGPMLVIQFAFEQHPNETQSFLLPQEMAKHLIAAATGTHLEDITPDAIENVKGFFLAFHEGLVHGIQAAKGESITSTEASCTIQIFTLPPNLQTSDEIVRVQAGITLDDQSSIATWLLDEATMRTILGLQVGATDEDIESELDSQQSPKVTSREERDMEILLDIPLELSVELGRVSLLVQDVIDLSAGSIVELEKSAGEPVDVLVNGRLVAHGEVVVIEDNFGVRITEIISPQERVHRLGEAA